MPAKAPPMVLPMMAPSFRRAGDGEGEGAVEVVGWDRCVCSVGELIDKLLVGCVAGVTMVESG